MERIAFKPLFFRRIHLTFQRCTVCIGTVPPPNRRCQSTHLKTLSADILGEENISKVCKPPKKYVQFNKMHDGGKKPRQDLSSFPVPKRKSTEFFCFYFRLLSTEFVFTGLFSGQMRWHTFLFRRLGHRGKFSITTDCAVERWMVCLFLRVAGPRHRF